MTRKEIKQALAKSYKAWQQAASQGDTRACRKIETSSRKLRIQLANRS